MPFKATKFFHYEERELLSDLPCFTSNYIYYFSSCWYPFIVYGYASLECTLHYWPHTVRYIFSLPQNSQTHLLQAKFFSCIKQFGISYSWPKLGCTFVTKFHPVVDLSRTFHSQYHKHSAPKLSICWKSCVFSSMMKTMAPLCSCSWSSTYSEHMG